MPLFPNVRRQISFEEKNSPRCVSLWEGKSGGCFTRRLCLALDYSISPSSLLLFPATEKELQQAPTKPAVETEVVVEEIEGFFSLSYSTFFLSFLAEGRITFGPLSADAELLMRGKKEEEEEKGRFSELLFGGGFCRFLHSRRSDEAMQVCGPHRAET